MSYYFIFIFVIFILAIYLYYISKPSKKDLEKYWGEINLNKERYRFYFLKTAAYRRIFEFFTALSYLLRILGIVSTFFLVYSVIQESKYFNILLVISALCDGVGLLFPFQKYIDTFTTCNVKMEECILNNSLLKEENEINENFVKAYIWCESYIHIEQKI